LIKLSYVGNQLVLEAATEVDRALIRKPIHRIFLRSSLGAQIHEDNYMWINQEQGHLISIIEGLLQHFNRYDISTNLDSRCEQLLEIKRKSDDAFIELLRKGLECKKGNLERNRKRITNLLSPGFVRELKDFQLDAVNHLLIVNNGANFSVPGSGKTSIALAYYHILLSTAKIDALLVIGPASCFEPWEHEYYECFKAKPNSIRIAGLSKIRRNELYLLAERYDLLLTTYHSATRDIDQIIESLKRRPYLVILDEAHYIKRPQGGKIAETVLTLAKYADYRVILTGTPMPNSLEDLWSQFAFLWNERSPLGSVESYLQEIRIKNHDTSIEKVRNKIVPLFWRVTKRQLNLPRITFRIVKCNLSPLQSRIYEGVAIQFLSQLKEEPKDREALREWRRARAIRLLQVASNPTLLHQQCAEFLLPPIQLGNLSLKHGIEYYSKYEVPSKFIAVEQIVTRLCEHGSKVIIWTSFVHNLTMLGNMLQNYAPVLIHGSVPFASSDDEELTREKLITRFKINDDCKLLIANPAACAESISLHDICHHAIYLDRTFNCAHYMQSLDRIHRIGLNSNQGTYYYLVIAENSIDKIVDDRLKQKMLNMEHILEDDLPGLVPGYWTEQLGDEEYLDLDLVEDHIKTYLK